MSVVKYGEGGQAPEMVRASSDDEKRFESMLRLGSKFITRTAKRGAWGGQWVHLFSAEMDDDDDFADDKDTWWSVCTMANGADTHPGWGERDTICPECMRLVIARGGLT